MYYRVRIELAFTSEDAIDDIRDKTLDHFGDAITVNPGKDNEEIGFIITEKCYHDEQPTKDCEKLSEHYTPH